MRSKLKYYGVPTVMWLLFLFGSDHSVRMGMICFLVCISWTMSVLLQELTGLILSQQRIMKDAHDGYGDQREVLKKLMKCWWIRSIRDS